ncbi:MAG: tetratricopeptide repeat protein [SAR324 cluster bacterium]|nr:tetratricopeptide repeat protein [SAR324 cluster bacterium]
MKHNLRIGLLGLLLTGLLAGLPGDVAADGNGGDELFSKNPDYVKAVDLIRDNKFAEAIPLLEKVVAKDERDADAYNMLGFSTRKLGRFTEALAHYKQALAIDPGHRGAHEYIGEAYLALGQLERAKVHLAFLDDDCWLPCEQFTDLKEAIASYETKTR